VVHRFCRKGSIIWWSYNLFRCQLATAWVSVSADCPYLDQILHLDLPGLRHHSSVLFTNFHFLLTVSSSLHPSTLDWFCIEEVIYRRSSRFGCGYGCGCGCCCVCRCVPPFFPLLNLSLSSIVPIEPRHESRVGVYSWNLRHTYQDKS
jgi:hypothetical protein